MNRKFLNALLKKIILLFIDAVAVSTSYVIATVYMSGYSAAMASPLHVRYYVLLTAVSVITFYVCRFYSSVWKYAGAEEYLKLILGISASTAACIFFESLAFHKTSAEQFFIAWALQIILISIPRFVYRILVSSSFRRKTSDTRAKRVLIIGAGNAGAALMRNMEMDDSLQPVAFIDDNAGKRGMAISRIPIVGGRDKIEETVLKRKIDMIVLAIPSLGKEDRKEIVNICLKTSAQVCTVPPMHEILTNKANVSKLRKIDFSDFLGRDEVSLNPAEVKSFIMGKTVMVTGGGGSIGSELCRQIIRFKPEKLIVFDIYENNAYDLEMELWQEYGRDVSLDVCIGSVRDEVRLNQVFETYKPQVVLHAAAHKHVPLMEFSPAEAVKNNVFGTLNTVKCAEKHGVETFVLISTDKAVNPTNVMGATKRIAEMIVQSFSKKSTTKFVAVRFGNVLGSNGSVIPLFRRQIAAGGPVTITHPEIIRYFMTIPEAAQLVLQAASIANGGEIFILDMGEPVKIADLAEKLIEFEGLRPYTDIKIEFTGLRPGEKLYEELLLAEEGTKATKHNKIYVARPTSIKETFISDIEKLRDFYDNTDGIHKTIEQLIGRKLKPDN